MKKKIILTLVIVIITISGVVLLINNKKETEAETKIDNNKKTVENIKKHYASYVITNKEAILYQKDNNEYIEYGKVNKDVSLELENVKVNAKTKYFKVMGLDLYISYQDVEKTEEFTNADRYKNYIPFNNNIVTKNTTTFYDENDSYLYTINHSFDFKVIVKDDSRYGVEYNNRLLYIHKDDIENDYDSGNRVLNIIILILFIIFLIMFLIFIGFIIYVCTY